MNAYRRLQAVDMVEALRERQRLNERLGEACEELTRAQLIARITAWLDLDALEGAVELSELQK